MRVHRRLNMSGAVRSLILSGALAVTLASPVQARSVTGELMDAAVVAELGALAPDAVYGAFVHFAQGSGAEQDAVLADHNLVIVKDFRKYATSVFVQGPAASFLAIGQHPWVTYIEHNAPMRYLGETQSWATRLRVAQEPVAGGPFYADAARTQILDGTGVTLGIIDSGVLGSHPDFGNLLYNFKLVNPTTITRLFDDPVTAQVPGYVEVGLADSESQVGGHGTHVTGTVGGTGLASNGFADGAVQPNIPGTYAGAAPGADLIHWGNGAGLLVLDTAAAYVDMLERLDDIENNPGFENLVAVNNSYGSDPGPYNPDATASQLTNEILSRGIVMAFAASNDGGDGSEAMTSPACRNPTPGLICVANYDDGGTGARDGGLARSSSRGLKTDASTVSFPDISAPGSNITSTCLQGLPSQAICSTGAETDWQPWYGTISGTSMATPHIVGIIGVLQQAHKGIHGRFMTPAEVEELLQRTALRVGDPEEYVEDPQMQGREAFAGIGQTTTHFGFGAGLVDVPAALAAIGGIPRGDDPVAGEPVVIFDQDQDSGTGSDVVAMSMRDATIDDVSGIEHVLVLGSDSLTDGTRYTIERNVSGVAMRTAVVVSEGVIQAAPLSDANNAPAARVSLVGNALSVFVASADMGSPAVGAPIHNIRVVVSDAIGTPLDFAPSPESSVDPLMDAQMSMFGNAFTVAQEAAGAVDVDPLVACEAPGRTILTDARGDIFALLDGAPENTATPFYDLRELSIIQPEFEAGSDYPLTFRLKMDGFPVVPLGNWPVNFCSPAFACENPDSNTTPYGADNKYYTVEMTTLPEQGGSPDAPAFRVRQPTASGMTSGSRTVVPALSGSVDPDGTILITVNASQIGLTAQGAGTETLSKFQSRVSPAATTPDNMPDALAGSGAYETLAAGSCSSGGGDTNIAPVAENGSATTASDTPVDLVLVASDADGDSLSYSIVAAPNHGTLSAVSGNAVTYTPDAGYNGADSFTFKASDGTDDSNVATVSLTVEEAEIEPNDGTLDPVLDVQTTSGSLDVLLDASRSAYESGDSIHEPQYRFIFGDDQDGDGEIDSTPFQGSAQMPRRYEAAGTYTATVIIRDGHGQSAQTSETFELEYNIEITPNPGQNQVRFTISDAAGVAPHRVEFDASPTVTADGWEVVDYRWDFDGDGLVDAQGANRVMVSHVYTQAGSYTPTLTVEFSDGQSAQSKSVSSRVTTTEERQEGPVATPNPPRASSGGSGSLGWLGLGSVLMAGFGRRRRRRV